MAANIELMSAANTPIVIVRDAVKSYHNKKSCVAVLKNVNMTVTKGTIYGLLGPSGCGKTTLLSCILGQKKLDNGTMWVLGGAPNTKESNIPGPKVGYMPQAPGIQDEYTIKETMYYFGGLAGMGNEDIKERMYFLHKLLMLPNINISLSSLSGGERRRISFAVSLIHKPELLILDEPTVGLDPLLRESIWSYLYEITSRGQTTVILTTHYIDEMRKANTVGLLRDGCILAEEPPEDLLSRFEVSTLEEVFFKLSSNQDNNVHNRVHIPNNISPNNYTPSTRNTKSPNYIKPLVTKNLQWLLKYPVIVLAAFMIPIVQILMFAFAVGGDPINLSLAIVNDETSIGSCSTMTCNSTHLSCTFLQYLESKFLMIYYENEDEAIKSVRTGHTYASIYFRQNYSTAFRKRINLNISDDFDLLYSNIDVYRDVSEYTLAMFLKLELIKGFQSFTEDYSKSCGNRNTKLMSLPIKWEKPVHGENLPNFSDFVIPSLVSSSLTFLTAWSTSSSLTMELNNGVSERTLVMGASTLHILLGHAISELLVLIIGLISISVCTFVINRMPLNLSTFLIVVFYGLTGLFGMCYGFALSSICSTDSLITLIIVGSLFPATILSGMLWPIEGMPQFLQRISRILPFAGVSDSIRSVAHRGWTITHSLIYTSILNILLWTVLFLIIGICFLKYKRP